MLERFGANVLNNKQRKKGLKRIQMIIKMVIQTHRRQFCTPKPDQPDTDLCMCVNLPLKKKIVQNQDWATGQS